MRNEKKTKEPWPTKDVMEQIYEEKLWGGSDHHFYSGEGSHRPEIVAPYIQAVTSFLSSFDEPLVVCDLGCGDFNVGKELVKHTKKYIAVDIVPALIERNRQRFQEGHLEFHTLDIAKDVLPLGDCALVRQVLQHLSNDEIKRVVEKLVDYKYLILTEHLPEGVFTPNLDIISGQGIRLKKSSGVDLLAPPFQMQVTEEKKLCTVNLQKGEGVIETKLFVI